MTFIAPMQALSVDKLPEGDWLYEIKLDGYRALAFKDGKNVRLVSRNNKPLALGEG
jgi:bifunctional non-homologous end joining protein LigD